MLEEFGMGRRCEVEKAPFFSGHFRKTNDGRLEFERFGKAIKNFLQNIGLMKPDKEWVMDLMREIVLENKTSLAAKRGSSEAR